MAPARSDRSRLFLTSFGPSSDLFQAWAKHWSPQKAEEFVHFDTTLSLGDPELCLRAYLSALARESLLLATRSPNLASVEWKASRPHPDWSILDRWIDERVSRSIHQALVGMGGQAHEDEVHPLACVDLVGLLHEAFLPSLGRKRGGEFYTPAWLARHLVSQVWTPGARWLDPTSGSGVFAQSVGEIARERNEPFAQFSGWDRSPASLLASAASIAWAMSRHAARIIDVGLLDHLARWKDGPNEQYDVIVGNPPWILWDAFDSQAREEMTSLWETYGLRIETGMNAILGGGKRDVALLILLFSLDRWLKVGGRSAVVLPQSVFKSAASARGFRQWILPGGVPLRVDHVEDLSRLRPFPSASVKTTLVYLTKGEPTRYPVRYDVWTGRDGKAIHALARPSDPDDLLSAWVHEPIQSLAGAEASDKTTARSSDSLVFGRSGYQARLGVNVGGASGLFWLQKEEEVSPTHWRMRNLVDKGKTPFPSRSVVLEAAYLVPVLLGKDVRAWQAKPSAWLLLTQNPATRQGWPIEELAQRAPLTLAYLSEFEETLRARAAFQRFFCRPGADGKRQEKAPFYSLFNVGLYTQSTIKVVWNRMGRRLAAAVSQGQEAGPVFPQETHAFIPVESLEEGDYLASLLNSPQARQWVEGMHVVSSKSLATPRVIHSLRLDPFDKHFSIHRELARLGRQAALSVEEGAPPSAAWQREFEQTCERYWKGE